MNVISECVLPIISIDILFDQFIICINIDIIKLFYFIMLAIKI